MKRLVIFFTLFLTVAVLFFVFDRGTDKGLDAYNKGDYATALKDLVPRAEQGDRSAQNSLGWMYDNGHGVPQDYEIAVKWYKLSAEQGNEAGQTLLGGLLFISEDKLQDYARAHMWLSFAALQGNESAIKIIGFLEKVISPVQLETAKRLARECVAKNYKDC